MGWLSNVKEILTDGLFECFFIALSFRRGMSYFFNSEAWFIFFVAVRAGPSGPPHPSSKTKRGNIAVIYKFLFFRKSDPNFLVWLTHFVFCRGGINFFAFPPGGFILP